MSRIVEALIVSFLSIAQPAFAQIVSAFGSGQWTTMVNDALTGVVAGQSTCAMRLAYSANNYNPALWCAPITDCTAFAREPQGGFYHKCLISPHHVILSNHLLPPIGTVNVWTDNASNSYGGTISQITQVAGSDIAVGYVRDSTSAEITNYVTSTGLTAPANVLSAAGISMSAASAIKPMAFFPAGNRAQILARHQPGIQIPSSWPLTPILQSVGASAPVGGVPPECIGVWDLTPGLNSFTNGGETSLCANVNQSTVALRQPFSLIPNVGNSQSGGCSFLSIPVGSSMAIAGASNGQVLGSRWPIVIGLNWLGVAGQNTSFDLPFLSDYLAGIQAAMVATATAAGDPLANTYAPVTVSLAAY